MCFLLYDGSELVGVCGVYVDDFIIAGSPNNRKWQLANEKLKKLYKWGHGETDSFTLCGVRYHQKRDFSVQMDQQEFTRKLTATDVNLPKFCTKQTEITNLTKRGVIFWC